MKNESRGNRCNLSGVSTTHKFSVVRCPCLFGGQSHLKGMFNPPPNQISGSRVVISVVHSNCQASCDSNGSSDAYAQQQLHIDEHHSFNLPMKPWRFKQTFSKTLLASQLECAKNDTQGWGYPDSDIHVKPSSALDE